MANTDPINLYLLESLKLTGVLFVVIILIFVTNSLSYFTNNKTNLEFIETIFIKSKYWGFILLIIERFLKLYSILLKNMCQHIIDIVNVIKDTIGRLLELWLL
jgi:hypothetical protein